MSDRREVMVDYTNWKGVRRQRRILPVRVYWSNGNEFHPEPQWLLEAVDAEDGKSKGFALKDIHGWQPSGPSETVAEAARRGYSS